MAADSDLNGPSSSNSVTLPRWDLIQYQPPYLRGSSLSRAEFQTLVVFRLAKNTFTPAFLTVSMNASDNLTFAPMTQLSHGNSDSESIIVN